MNEIRVAKQSELQGRQGVSWHWDIPRIITAYHDPIIQASFLRASRPEELVLDHASDLVAAAKRRST